MAFGRPDLKWKEEPESREKFCAEGQMMSPLSRLKGIDGDVPLMID
jgi:hypothetical protein